MKFKIGDIVVCKDTTGVGTQGTGSISSIQSTDPKGYWVVSLDFSQFVGFKAFFYDYEVRKETKLDKVLK